MDKSGHRVEVNPLLSISSYFSFPHVFRRADKRSRGFSKATCSAHGILLTAQSGYSLQKERNMVSGGCFLTGIKFAYFEDNTILYARRSCFIFRLNIYFLPILSYIGL